jgi:hypothetical protein
VPLTYRRRIVLWRSRKPGVDADRQTELYLTVKLPTRRQPSPIGLGVRWHGITWNTSRGFASARLGRGFTWQDRD